MSCQGKDVLVVHVLEKMDEVQNNVLREVSLVRESQIRMEADVKYHIKRTDTLEGMVQDHNRFIRIALAPIELVGWVLKKLKIVG